MLAVTLLNNLDRLSTHLEGFRIDSHSYKQSEMIGDAWYKSVDVRQDLFSLVAMKVPFDVQKKTLIGCGIGLIAGTNNGTETWTCSTHGIPKIGILGCRRSNNRSIS